MIKIGCEAYIVNSNKVLLGKRGKVFGEGTWALPGGHLETMERADECLCRELLEETGMNVTPNELELLAVTDDIQSENGIHYIHITFKVDTGDQKPKLLEPNECYEWKWFDLDKMPEPFFGPHRRIFDTINSRKIYSTQKSI